MSKGHWTLEEEKISLSARLRGRHYHWTPPTWICNERDCVNPAYGSSSKCDLCIERIAAQRELPTTEEWRVVVKWESHGDPYEYARPHPSAAPFDEEVARRFATDMAAYTEAEWVRVERRTVTPWEEA